MSQKGIILIFVVAGLMLALVGGGMFFYDRNNKSVVAPIESDVPINSNGLADKPLEKEMVDNNGMPPAVQSTLTQDAEEKRETNGMPAAVASTSTQDVDIKKDIAGMPPAVPSTSTQDVEEKRETNGMPAAVIEPNSVE